MVRNSYLLSLDPNFVPAKKSKKKIILTIIYYVVGAALSIFFILPLLYMLAASTKSDEAIGFANSSGSIAMFLPDFSSASQFFANYKEILFGKYEIWKYGLNSLIYAAIAIVFNVLVNGLAGYVLAKFRFPGKGFFNFLILFLIIVPVETSIIPLWMIVKVMLNLNDYTSVILPSIISVFNIFLFTQFFSSIPKEYEEAMHIDGASRVRMFFDLILPLSKPIVATVMVFTFIGVWNDYVWPYMVVDKDASGWSALTIQAGITFLQSDNTFPVGAKMASLVLTTIPIFILYAAAQKYIVKGFGTAGLKM